MCFSWHSRVAFVLGGGNPRRAEQGQAGEEVEEGHQSEHRAKRRAGGGFHQRRQGVGHHDLNHLKANRREQCSAEQRFLARTMARQAPENPEEQQVVGEDGDRQPDAAPARASAIRCNQDRAQR